MSEPSSARHRLIELRPGSRLTLSLAILLVHLDPTAVRSQDRFRLTGSVALTESYDDNVFARPDDRQQDLVSRLSPQLGASFRSHRLGVVARYTRDLESFKRHPELSSLGASQEASLDVQWTPGAGFEAAGGASYAETHLPSQFYVITDMQLTGLELRRSLARRLSTTLALSHRLGARTRTVAEYGSTRDDIVGGIASETQVGAARIERQVGPTDSVSLAYGLRRMTSEGSGTLSHALALTWARAVTSRTHLELKAGPRLSGQSVRPELGASLRHRFRRGEAALAYVHTEAGIIGHPASVTAEGLTLTLTHRLGRRLTLTGGPSIFQARGEAVETPAEASLFHLGGEAFEATVYRLGTQLSCHLTRHLSVAASYQLSLQYGALDGRPLEQTVHNTVLLRLVAGSVD